MKIVVVCSRRYYAQETDYVAPFIYEQVKELEQLGCQFKYVLIQAGWKSYLKTFLTLKKEIKNFSPDIIHAHGGHCGFIANLQKKIPVVTTYHGSDINSKKTRIFSLFSIKSSKFNIFVSQKLLEISGAKVNAQVIPCGVDTKVFYPMDKQECRKKLGWENEKTYILFSKAFEQKVKNYPLAKAAVDCLENAKLIELKGYTREEVNWLFNACDVALMTSISEGSPQFVKEAMACNKSVVSTDVGDVKELFLHTKNSLICSYEVADVVLKLKQVLSSHINNDSRDYVQTVLANHLIAEKILKVYNIAKKI